MFHPRFARWKACLLATCLVAFSGSRASADPPQRIYLIGNSLTWDTTPRLLEGDVQWHVDCGKSLPYIQSHPDKPCVKDSTLWPSALREKQYDVVSVQPHYGSTLQQDVETISRWMALQPHATFVLHTGWARRLERAEEDASYAAPDEMLHSLGYIRALLAELRRLHPGRELRQSFAQTLLAQVAADIDNGQAPIEQLEHLYRDAIHMTLDHGRYLMHNAMRRALGLPYSEKGFAKLNPQWKTYLDGKLRLLKTSTTDRELLRRVLAPDFKGTEGERRSLVNKISNEELRASLAAMLPQLAEAVAQRHKSLKLASEVEAAGGRVVWSPRGPAWLYLATEDQGMELFDVPTAIDLYNGNNPLKGRGGRNELVTDQWLEKLSNAGTVRQLNLANCDVHSEGLAHLQDLVGLRELNLTLTSVDDAGLRHLQGLTELRILGLASTQCTGTGFRDLRALRKLESVNLHFTPLTDAGLAEIARIPLSDRLWFAHTQFTDTGAKALSALTNLKRCGIGSANKQSSGAAVAALSQLRLDELSLLDNQATPEGLRHAAKIRTLRRLEVAYAPTVTDEELPLFAQMPRLQELTLGGAKCSDEGLKALIEAKTLTKLVLKGIKGITPAGVEQLRKARPDLSIEFQ
ncbi:MAG: hypothetical protein KDB14_10630 [Planctomycetales bacterium]|nr:hypothetical protein [Planctomycetales bacterium]